MPSPVAHTLAACSLFAAAAGRAPALRTGALFAVVVVAANLPDLDLLGTVLNPAAGDLHQAATHSAAFVLAGAVPLALLLRRTLPFAQAWRWVAAAGLLHLALDLAIYDAIPPVGLPLAWPFSDARWQFPVLLFPGTDRSHLFGAANLRELAAELLWTVPPLAFLTRRRIEAVLRCGLAGRRPPLPAASDDRAR